MLLKNLLFYIPLVSSAIHAVQCTRSSQRSRDTRWPVIYANNEAAPIIYDPSQPLSIYMDLLKDGLFMVSNETELLPVAKSVMNYDQNSEVSKELMFVSALCKTTNCRESLDLWDCPTCKEILPDAIVVRSFKTFPNDVTGHILKSESLKSIFIQVRGANSDRNRVLWSRRQLIEHPFIPDILVSEGYLTSALDVRSIINDTLKDQLILHPDYKVVVAGHSFGAGVGSVIATHVKHDFPQLTRDNFKAYLIAKPRVGNYNYAKYVAEQDIKILRVVNALDEAPHRPSILDGYVHEGDEYWLKYYNNGELELKFCPGPFETRNCSSSAPYFSAFEHSEIFGIQEACVPDGSLHLNFTALMERLANDTELTAEEIQLAQEASQVHLSSSNAI